MWPVCTPWPVWNVLTLNLIWLVLAVAVKVKYLQIERTANKINTTKIF